MHLFLIILLLVSCRMEDNSSKGNSHAMYNITGLLEDQIQKLSQISANLMKTVSIDGIEESVEIPGIEVDWEETLKIFNGIDISSPGLVGVYNIQEYDSGLTHIYRYLKKPDEQGKVEFLRIEEYPEGDISISAGEVLDNPIYKSRSFTNINLINTGRFGLLIHRFQLEGYQKIISRDTMHYSIVGIISIKER